MQASQFITTVTEHIVSMNFYIFSVFLRQSLPLTPVWKKQEETINILVAHF